MSVRYIFNTNGEYVAFLNGKYLFTPSCEWIGFNPQGNLLFNVDGTYMGELSTDDRIVRNKNTNYQKLLRPLRPLKPLRPLRPLRRLRMLRMPNPYVDVFENSEGYLPTAITQDFSYLEGTDIIAGNNTFLGKITKNKYDQQSIFNQYGTYGSKYSAESIFNDYSPYGGQYGQYSPMNNFATSPPKITRNKSFVAWLTTNQYLSGEKIDPIKFFDWVQNS